MRFLRMAADVWVVVAIKESGDRASGRVRFRLVFEPGADVALRDAVEDARGRGAPWAGAAGC